MPVIKIDDKEFEVDSDGFLTNPELWNNDVAEFFAKSDGTGELSEKHWVVINYLREYWKANNRAPAIRKMCQSTNLRFAEIYELFPMGPAKGACKIAGLPKPDTCV